MSRVIDADAHVVEGPAFFSEALKRWPGKVAVAGGGRPGLVVEGRRYPESEGPGAGCPPQHGLTPAAGDPGRAAGMLADADREGIDRMLLFPSFGLGIAGYRDAALAAGMARLYNAWVRDFCAEGGGRLHAAAVVPLEDVHESVAIAGEARRAGLPCVVVPPALRERNLDHPDLDPFYAAAADLDLPVCVHGAPGVHLPKIGVDRFTQYVQVHCVSFPFDMMAALTSLVSGGVLERHAKLRVVLLESGVGWVPYFFDRLHEHWEKRGDWIADGWRREPREYLARGQIYVSCEPEESMLPAAIAALGADFALYASDYPHWDSDFPESAKSLRERGDLPEAARRAILGENAARCFGLPD